VPATAGAVKFPRHKGTDRYAAAKVDRDIGGLWAELSDGKCRFVMVTDKKWEALRDCLD
jgi:type III restriction enzyme